MHFDRVRAYLVETGILSLIRSHFFIPTVSFNFAFPASWQDEKKNRYFPAITDVTIMAGRKKFYAFYEQYILNLLLKYHIFAKLKKFYL